MTYRRFSWYLAMGKRAGGLCSAGMKLVSRLNSAILVEDGGLAGLLPRRS